MSDDQVKAMILEVIENVDYDIYKSFLPECSEDPEESEEEMEKLIAVCRKHLEK